MKSVIEPADIVISYVPNFLQTYVAKTCLEVGRNLVTASYVLPDTKELDAEVKNKGLIFLNEIGLDPGIDHFATMKVKN